jgi:hypothetical protein
MGVWAAEWAHSISCYKLVFLQVYVIDFGLAKNHHDPTTHQHIPYMLGLFRG